jgi:hypothetical protein
MPDLTCRVNPCESCPYRRDVPSGIWAPEEYAKLQAYDLGTAWQPPQMFYCHTSPDFVCTGWAVCHSKAKRGHELLAVRIAESMHDAELMIPETAVPLFASGAEAAVHGMRDIKRPGWRAIRMTRKIAAARARKS